MQLCIIVIYIHNYKYNIRITQYLNIINSLYKYNNKSKNSSNGDEYYKQ